MPFELELIDDKLETNKLDNIIIIVFGLSLSPGATMEDVLKTC